MSSSAVRRVSEADIRRTFWKVRCHAHEASSSDAKIRELNDEDEFENLQIRN